MRFEDRVVLVTGGAQGLGEAICELFAREGASVIVSDVNEESAKATAQRLAKDYAGRSLGVKMDVTDDSQVQAAVEMIEKDVGRLDILIANAGILKAHELVDFPVSEWRHVIEVDLVCLLYTSPSPRDRS